VSESVLYMEDDDAQARLVRRCFERAGYAVESQEGEGAAFVLQIPTVELPSQNNQSSPAEEVCEIGA
jgi:hypothetical protein